MYIAFVESLDIVGIVDIELDLDLGFGFGFGFGFVVHILVVYFGIVGIVVVVVACHNNEDFFVVVECTVAELGNTEEFVVSEIDTAGTVEYFEHCDMENLG